MRTPVILVVDDESSVRSALSVFLKDRLDAEVLSFACGEEVIQYLKENKADIILLDIKMPGKGGIKVIEEITKIGADIDIIVVSAWVSSDVANEAIRAGAGDYIAKPLDLKVLELKVSDILNKRKTSHQ